MRDEPQDTAARYASAFVGVDALAVEVNLAIIRASNMFARALRRRLEPLQFGLNPPRYLVLRTLFLADQQRLPVGEIARRLGVSSTNLTTLIDVLVRDGWVDRVSDDQDRRLIYAQLTDLGRERCEMMLPKMLDLMHELVAGIPREDQQRLVASLTQMRAAAESFES
jgi:MarR family 2-MHQ and catechol resistance regulon transcriptional repressor